MRELDTASATDQHFHRAGTFRPLGKIYFLVGHQRDLLEDEWISHAECQRDNARSPSDAAETDARKEMTLGTSALCVVSLE